MNKELPSIGRPSLEDLEIVSTDLRRKMFEVILNAKSGHLGGCSSSVELMTALYFGGVLNFDVNNPSHPNRDLVLVRGHLGPLRYSIFSYLGYIKESELSGYRKFGTRLHGHESMSDTPGVDLTPSGSLGMLLSYSVGAAVADRENSRNRKIYTFLGDGEEQEGNVSEAARFAASERLTNLICIIDQNGKQLSNSTDQVDGRSNINKIWQGYGWNTVRLKNGHDFEQIFASFKKTETADKPTIIIAQTIKGKGLPGATGHFNGAHTIGSFRNDEGVETGIRELTKKMGDMNITHEDTLYSIKEMVKGKSLDGELEKPKPDIKFRVSPDNSTPRHLEEAQIPYIQSMIHTLRMHQGEKPNFYIITPDFVLQPLIEIYKLSELGRYLDVGLREQHAISMAHGISTIDRNARLILFYGDAFMYRSADQLNAAAQGGSSMMILAERAGICQEKNGQTHQSSGQPGAVLTMPGVAFKEPGDVKDLFNIFNWFFTENPGVLYLRTHSKPVPDLSRASEDDNNINHYIVHEPDKTPNLVMAATGLMVHNAIDAAKTLELESKLNTRVINVIDPKSLNEDFVRSLYPNVPLFTLYNGSPEVLAFPASKAIMEHKDKLGSPSRIIGHGFYNGTTGSIVDLEKHLRLDSEGITNLVLSNLSNAQRVKK